MGIYIPGMEMPCEGLMTIIAIGYDGRVFQPIEYPDEHTLYHGTKYNAIELPPHGRLIDADALRSNMYDSLTKQFYINQKQIENAHTIIPSEEE